MHCVLGEGIENGRQQAGNIILLVPSPRSTLLPGKYTLKVSSAC